MATRIERPSVSTFVNAVALADLPRAEKVRLLRDACSYIEEVLAEAYDAERYGEDDE